MHAHLEALENARLRPLWHDPAIMPAAMPPLARDEKCELLIVGGGFTGLWAALQAKERRPQVDIILIEQSFIADGASGRCGGFLSTSIAHGETNSEHHFPGESERLQQLGEQNIREYLESLERYGIDARYEKTGETSVALDPEGAARLHRVFEEKKSDGEDVVFFDREGIRAEVDSPLFHAGLWRRGGDDGLIDPARLCWGLKKTLLDLGVRIFEGTRLLDIEPLGRHGMKAECAGGTIGSDKVLLATNAFPSSLRKIRRSIVPVWDYQLATEPLSVEQQQAIGWPRSRHALSDFNNMFHYFRLTRDNRITWGGGGSVRYYFNGGTDARFGDAPARYEQLAREFFEYFPQLEGLKFSNKWGGIIATSTRFCMVPGSAWDGRVAWSVGYTGHGVCASRFGARVGIELLGYEPSDILDLQFVTGKALPWAPEPFRWLGIRMTQRALIEADRNGGRRGLWLKLLDKLNLGFTC